MKINFQAIYEERTVPRHPPKSVVRGKTRVLAKNRQPENGFHCFQAACFDFLINQTCF